MKSNPCPHHQLMCGIPHPASYILPAFLFFLLISCTGQRADSTPPPSTLIPFLTSTRIPSPSTEIIQTPDGLVSAEAPLPSPTPFTYTVQKGDTFGSIALKFSVSIDGLQAANPQVSPNAMPVGQVLNIPSSPENPSGEPTPRPAPFMVQQIECYPTADKGMWCFVLVHNEFPELIENVSAQITLVDANNTTIATQTAWLPLNILPPDTSLPLAVFFPPEIPSNAKPQVQILTAIRLLPDDERYLPATINNTLVQVDADGGYAQVSGVVLLPGGAKAASQVWVAGTAYDEAGRVVGVRRWESSAGSSADESLPFAFMISSLAGEIARVEFAVEARP